MRMPSFNRRQLGKGIAAAGLMMLAMSGVAHAAGSIVVATFPGDWEDAYRKLITPILAGEGTQITMAPALTTLQIANTLAAKKTGAAPPYDALTLSPGDTAVALQNDLIEKIDPTKLKNWDKLPKQFQTDYGPVVTVQFCGIGYNPDVVPKPASYKDLFENPAYKGKVAFNTFESNTEIMAFSQIAKAFGTGPMDMDAVFKLFKDKKDWIGAIVDNTQHEMSMFQQGEIAVFMACANNISALQALGVHAEFAAPAEGVPAVPVVLHMVKGTKNPDAVYQYMDAAIDATVQTALEAPPIENFPTNSDVVLTPNISKFATKDSLASFVYLDWVTVAKNRAKWTEEYDRAVKG